MQAKLIRMNFGWNGLTMTLTLVSLKSLAWFVLLLGIGHTTRVISVSYIKHIIGTDTQTHSSMDGSIDSL